MAKFRKSIVSVGKYLVSRLGGKRAEEKLSEDRLKKWAETANKMISSGISIPAPWSHIGSDGKVPFPAVMDSNGSLPRSDINAGWWEKFEVDNGTLFGILDVPDENKSKIGTTVKETSVFVQPNYVDGKGNEWPEALMHIALVTHPIEPGQPNFQPIAASLLPESEPLILAMSDLIMADQQAVVPARSFTIKDVIEHLQQVGIVLLDDTTPANLAERLVAAVKQKLATEQESKDESAENVTNAPNNSQTQPAPVAMSQETKTEVKPSPALTDQQVKTLENLEKQNAFLMSEISEQKKRSLLDRIKKLIETGRVSKEYAEKTLIPQSEGIKMSIGNDGKITRLDVETILEALESSQPLTKPIVDGLRMSEVNMPDDSKIEPHELPFGEEPDLTDDQIKEIMMVN